MTSYKTLVTRRDNLRKLKISNRRVNELRISKNNSYLHEKTKFEVAWFCLQNGWDYVSEAEFEKGGRADIYILDTDTAVEVGATETMKECMKKSKKYPVSSVIFVSALVPKEQIKDLF